MILINMIPKRFAIQVVLTAQGAFERAPIRRGAVEEIIVNTGVLKLCEKLTRLFERIELSE